MPVHGLTDRTDRSCPVFKTLVLNHHHFVQGEYLMMLITIHKKSDVLLWFKNKHVNLLKGNTPWQKVLLMSEVLE